MEEVNAAESLKIERELLRLAAAFRRLQPDVGRRAIVSELIADKLLSGTAFDRTGRSAG